MRRGLQFSQHLDSPYREMPDDILLNKGQIIRRCIARVHEEYRIDPARADEFAKIMHQQMRRIRRRDGAFMWELFNEPWAAADGSQVQIG